MEKNDSTLSILVFWLRSYVHMIVLCLLCRIGPMRYIKKWKILNPLEVEIKMLFWLLVYTLLAGRRISLVL